MTSQRQGRGLRITARVIGLIGALFFFAMVAGDAIDTILTNGFQALDPEGLSVVLPVAFAIIAYIIAWWRERAGGILLIIAYVVLSGSPTFRGLFRTGSFHIFSDMWLYTLPFLIAGVFFLLAGRASSPHRSTANS